jgi:hypothetical protein
MAEKAKTPSPMSEDEAEGPVIKPQVPSVIVSRFWDMMETAKYNAKKALQNVGHAVRPLKPARDLLSARIERQHFQEEIGKEVEAIRAILLQYDISKKKFNTEVAETFVKEHFARLENLFSMRAAQMGRKYISVGSQSNFENISRYVKFIIELHCTSGEPSWDNSSFTKAELAVFITETCSGEPQAIPSGPRRGYAAPSISRFGPYTIERSGKIVGKRSIKKSTAPYKSKAEMKALKEKSASPPKRRKSAGGGKKTKKYVGRSTRQTRRSM